MPEWAVELHPAFDAELDNWPAPAREEMLAQAGLLARFGPGLGRPRVDTLVGSAHANMKELRFAADKAEWRVAFAFDPRRRAILLVGGSKSGVSQSRFYASLIRRADARYADHLASLRTKRK